MSSVKETQVYWVREDLTCDNCNETMISRNVILLSYPPQYQYYCPKCDTTETSLTMYPNYVEKEKEQEYAILQVP